VASAPCPLPLRLRFWICPCRNPQAPGISLLPPKFTFADCRRGPPRWRCGRLVPPPSHSPLTPPSAASHYAPQQPAPFPRHLLSLRCDHRGPPERDAAELVGHVLAVAHADDKAVALPGALGAELTRVLRARGAAEAPGAPAEEQVEVGPEQRTWRDLKFKPKGPKPEVSFLPRKERRQEFSASRKSRQRKRQSCGEDVEQQHEEGDQRGPRHHSLRHQRRRQSGPRPAASE
ncbi:hypothetical protein Zm00014a_011482, partial [Zea mays]